MRFKRIFLIVLDSLGVGAAMDADQYQDTSANTLGHIKENYDLFIPNLKKLGFLNTIQMDENPQVDAYYTIARPTNVGKDTLSGHYEMMGIRSTAPFRTFAQNGFPRELIEMIEEVTGRSVIGNKRIEEDEVLAELGERQVNYGSLIIFTNSDSNLQVAAHDSIVSVGQLYQYCERIRKITLREDWKVGRVIARPFTGSLGHFHWTNERRDYAVKPPKDSILCSLKNHGLHVISIGKINDIFDGEGITKVIKATDNHDVVNKLSSIMDKNFTGLCYANLSDFDSLYGHKRDVIGYAKAIEELDVEIPLMLNKLGTEDLFILTADHGNDPVFQGSDHTRENVPVILFSRDFKTPGILSPFSTLADIGAIIADNFQVEEGEMGTSILSNLK